MITLFDTNQLNSSMSCQDWTPVILRKNNVYKQETKPPIHPDAKRVRMLDAYNEGPTPKLEKVSTEDKKELTQLRILKKLTQEELNQRLHLKKDTIKTIENGTHEKNKQLTQKIKAYLVK